MIYLTAAELLHVAERATGQPVILRGLVKHWPAVQAAAARPQATAFGTEAYPDVDAKAAALLHSLAGNHALVDGNKRLALAAVVAFYGVNGRRLTLSSDAAYELVMQVAARRLDSVDDIAAILRPATELRQ